MLDLRDRSSIMFIMNKLPREKRVQVLHMLVEGNSLRAAARLTDVSRNTVDKLLHDVGEACFRYQDAHLRNLPCQRVKCDAIWSFVHAREKDVPEDKRDQFGHDEVWIWTAIDADTKLVPCWRAGTRDLTAAREFIADLAARLSSRVQLTTDGHKPYLTGIDETFGSVIDYGSLVKLYGNHTTDGSMRRVERLISAHSRKVENLIHAISLHFMYYNFARIHSSLSVTPAMAAGVSDHAFSLDEIAALMNDEPPRKRGPYKKS